MKKLFVFLFVAPLLAFAVPLSSTYDPIDFVPDWQCTGARIVGANLFANGTGTMAFAIDATLLETIPNGFVQIFYTPTGVDGAASTILPDDLGMHLPDQLQDFLIAGSRQLSQSLTYNVRISFNEPSGSPIFCPLICAADLYGNEQPCDVSSTFDPWIFSSTEYPDSQCTGLMLTSAGGTTMSFELTTSFIEPVDLAEIYIQYIAADGTHLEEFLPTSLAASALNLPIQGTTQLNPSITYHVVVRVIVNEWWNWCPEICAADLSGSFLPCSDFASATYDPLGTDWTEFSSTYDPTDRTEVAASFSSTYDPIDSVPDWQCTGARIVGANLFANGTGTMAFAIDATLLQTIPNGFVQIFYTPTGVDGAASTILPDDLGMHLPDQLQDFLIAGSRQLSESLTYNVGISFNEPSGSPIFCPLICAADLYGNEQPCDVSSTYDPWTDFSATEYPDSQCTGLMLTSAGGTTMSFEMTTSFIEPVDLAEIYIQYIAADGTHLEEFLPTSLAASALNLPIQGTAQLNPSITYHVMVYVIVNGWLNWCPAICAADLSGSFLPCPDSSTYDPLGTDWTEFSSTYDPTDWSEASTYDPLTTAPISQCVGVELTTSGASTMSFVLNLSLMEAVDDAYIEIEYKPIGLPTAPRSEETFQRDLTTSTFNLPIQGSQHLDESVTYLISIYFLDSFGWPNKCPKICIADLSGNTVPCDNNSFSSTYDPTEWNDFSSTYDPTEWIDFSSTYDPTELTDFSSTYDPTEWTDFSSTYDPTEWTDFSSTFDPTELIEFSSTFDPATTEFPGLQCTGVELTSSSGTAMSFIINLSILQHVINAHIEIEYRPTNDPAGLIFDVLIRNLTTTTVNLAIQGLRQLDPLQTYDVTIYFIDPNGVGSDCPQICAADLSGNALPCQEFFSSTYDPIGSNWTDFSSMPSNETSTMFSSPPTNGSSTTSFSSPPTNGSSTTSFSSPPTNGSSTTSFSSPPTNGSSTTSFSSQSTRSATSAQTLSSTNSSSTATTATHSSSPQTTASTTTKAAGAETVTGTMSFAIAMLVTVVAAYI